MFGHNPFGSVEVEMLSEATRIMGMKTAQRRRYIIHAQRMTIRERVQALTARLTQRQPAPLNDADCPESTWECAPSA